MRLYIWNLYLWVFNKCEIHDVQYVFPGKEQYICTCQYRGVAI